MNIKELSEVAGVSISTIRRVAKNLFPDHIKKGVKTDFSKEQCFDIMRKTNKKNKVDLGDVQHVQNDEQVEHVDYEALGKMIGVAVAAALSPVVSELKEMRSTQLALPEPVKEDSYSLVGYCRMKKMTVARSELALHGKELKKMANRKGITLRRIPDERWGEVNSYPVTILDEYFAA